MNAALYRPCASNRGPVNEFGTFMYDRGASWKGSRYHRGTDVPVAQGTPLYGCGDGVVTAIAQTQKVGYIWIVTVRYEVQGLGVVLVQTQHHSRIDVIVGQHVTLSTLLGLSGGTPGTLGAGNSNGAHVHLEVYVNGVLTDPDTVLNFRSELAGGGTVPLPNTSEEEDMKALYFMAVDNTGLSVNVGVNDWWVRDTPSAPLRRLTQGQVADAFAAEGISDAPFNRPNVQGKPGSWFAVAFDEDRIVHGYNVLTHPYLAPDGTAALDEATVQRIAAETASATERVLADDFAGAAERVIASVPSAEQNGAAARAAIVK